MDKAYVQKPKRLSVRFIRNYTIVFRLISSVFDLITFAVLLFIFTASPQQFQSSWFIEGLATQVLIIFVIRTRITSVYRSKPSRLLTFSSLSIVVVGFLLPYTPIGTLFQLVAPAHRVLSGIRWDHRLLSGAWSRWSNTSSLGITRRWAIEEDASGNWPS